MFSVPRFDAGASAGTAQAHGAPPGAAAAPDAALSALNARIAAKRAAAPPRPGVAGPSAAPAPAPVLGTGLAIHPSRLAAAPLLRASANKARTAAGVAAPRTKAKERYLRGKKERRKLKSKHVAAPAPGEGKLARQPSVVLPSVPAAGPDTAAGDEADTAGEAFELERQRLLRREQKRRMREERSAKRARADEAAATPAAQASRPAKKARRAASDAAQVAEPHAFATPPAAAVATPSAVAAAPDGASSSASSSSASSSASSSRASTPAQDDAAPSAAKDAADLPQALMRFPEPHATFVPDQERLAAQGLPQGLRDATIVDPAHRGTLDEDDGEAHGLHVGPEMKRRLAELGVKDWFAVQTAVLPLLLADDAVSTSLYPSHPARDLCVSAPTGSGKTLAYAVPLVVRLRARIIPAVRALVVLPTRDLVTQVLATFDRLCRGTPLRTAALGLGSFAAEAKALGESVDIVVATPGRLVDHLNATPGFTLQHLRWLVIDEADRLLAQSFQSWLPRLLGALEPAPRDCGSEVLAPAWLRQEAAGRGMPVGERVPRESHVQKLLFSATLTRDPAKIAALELRQARFISVRSAADGSRTHTIDAADDFALPATLREHMAVVAPADKPLVLLSLLYTREAPLRRVLVFTKSVESSGRLLKLLQFFAAQWPGPAVAAEKYSSDLTPHLRARTLARFKRGEIDVLIASDLISRGMDLPHVDHVLSYDVPVDMAKYVHRVGRTARAGREGDAWTLVEKQEARYFRAMLERSARKAKVKKLPPLDDAQRERLGATYEAALAQLGEYFTRH